MATEAPSVRPTEELRGLREAVGERPLRDVAADVERTFASNHLLVFSSAIAFRILLALVPLALLGVALLGFLDLEEVWRDSVAPEIRDRTSSAGFTVIERTVEHVLGAKEGFWLTAGAAIALWEISGAVRVTSRALDRIYEVRPARPVWRRFAVSIGLSFPLAGFVLGALATAQLLPPYLDHEARWGLGGEIAGRAVGWALAALLLAAAIGLLIRYAPSERQPFRLVGWATVLIVVAWALSSALFGIYVTRIASYGSVFGGLSVAFILMLYVYLSATVFLVGVQLDAYLRRLSEQEADAGRARASPERAEAPRRP